jgi:uncharacterized protein (TIGR03435 family)
VIDLAVTKQEGSPNPEQVRIMIRKLLADRFGLKFHREKREMSAYVLSVGKDGSKLKPTQIQGTLPGTRHTGRHWRNYSERHQCSDSGLHGLSPDPCARPAGRRQDGTDRALRFPTYVRT